MKKVKNIVLATALALFAAGTVSAQDATVKPKKELSPIQFKPKAKTAERLGLTEEQKSKYKAINDKYSEKTKAIKAEEGDKIPKLEETKTLHIQKDAEIQALLTPEQYKTYTEIREEKKLEKKNSAKEKAKG